jgi:hypothetical protein
MIEALNKEVNSDTGTRLLWLLKEAILDLGELRDWCLHLESDPNMAPEELKKLGADSRFRELYKSLDIVIKGNHREGKWANWSLEEYDKRFEEMDKKYAEQLLKRQVPISIHHLKPINRADAVKRIKERIDPYFEIKFSEGEIEDKLKWCIDAGTVQVSESGELSVKKDLLIGYINEIAESALEHARMTDVHKESSPE